MGAPGGEGKAEFLLFLLSAVQSGAPKQLYRVYSMLVARARTLALANTIDASLRMLLAAWRTIGLIKAN